MVGIREADEAFLGKDRCAKTNQEQKKVTAKGCWLKKSVNDRLRDGMTVDDKTGCWNWKKHKTIWGYSQMRYMGKNWAGHRLSYEMFRGPIPVGFDIDHLCRNRACINPDHLEPVTPKENKLRGVGVCALNKIKTKCSKGHPYSAENTRTYEFGGSVHRGCRECDRIRQRKYHDKNRDLINAKAREKDRLERIGVLKPMKRRKH